MGSKACQAIYPVNECYTDTSSPFLSAPIYGAVYVECSSLLKCVALFAPTPGPHPLPPNPVIPQPTPPMEKTDFLTCSKLALRSMEGALVSLRSGSGESSKAEVLRSMSEVFRLKESAALLVQVSVNTRGQRGGGQRLRIDMEWAVRCPPVCGWIRSLQLLMLEFTKVGSCAGCF